jgi:hypothetical protein
MHNYVRTSRQVGVGLVGGHEHALARGERHVVEKVDTEAADVVGVVLLDPQAQLVDRA